MIDRMSGRISLLLVSAALILVVPARLVRARRAAAVESVETRHPGRPDERPAAGRDRASCKGPIGRQSLASLRVSQIAVPDDPKMSQILRQLSAAASLGRR